MRQDHTSSNKSLKVGKRIKNKPVDVSAAAAVSPVIAITAGAMATGHKGASRAIAVRVDSAKMTARYDRPGHLAEAHAERLLRVSRARAAREESGLVFDSAGDDFASELAEQAVISMVGGGETWLDTVNAPVEEEDGGPFLETPAEREFASGPEAEDDTEGFLREALPTASAGNSVPFEGARRRRRS